MSTDQLVVLRGGVSVPAAAYVLLLDFEARGINIWREGDRLIVQPGDHLSQDDDRALRTLKPYLLTLVAYSLSTPADVLYFTDQPREAAHA